LHNEIRLPRALLLAFTALVLLIAPGRAAPDSGTTPIDVAIISPTLGSTVSGTVAVTASVTNGSADWVDFVVDGIVQSRDDSKPYTFAWLTSAVSDGQHTIVALATTPSGRVNSASVTVYTQNGPTLDLTSPTVSSPPFNTGGPSISGQAVVGSTLTAQPGSWSGTAPITYSYAWKRCTASAGCMTIVGASSSSYVVASADVGYSILVIVLATNSAGSASATSAGTAVVTAPVASGWTNVINTDFTSDGVLPAPWKAYDFANSLAGGGYYLPSHVVVSGGIASLVEKYEASGPARNSYYTADGGGWYQGTIYAAGSGPWVSVDHRTTVRMRIVSNGVTSHRGLPMWWPESGNGGTDGEEDFFESDGVWWPPIGGQEQPRSFFHYGGNTQVYWIWNPIDLSQWHTYRFERLAHKITIWVDDMTTPVWSQQYSSTELPDTLKHPIFQQENPNFLPPSGTTGSEEIQIDWVQVDVPS
jgi:hypothetical protein